MCNCNQQRTAYSNQHSSPERTQRGMVKVKLMGEKPLIINGDITGRTYVFRNINDINWVDKRDAIQFNHIKDLQILN